MHESFDLGLSWQYVSTVDPAGCTWTGLLVDRLGTLYRWGPCGVMTSDTGGATWTVRPSALGDTQVLSLDRGRPGHLFAWTAYGLAESFNSGGTWVTVGLPSRLVPNIDAFGDLWLASDGVYLYERATASYAERNVGIDAAGTVAVATTPGALMALGRAGLLRRPDGQEAWQTVRPGENDVYALYPNLLPGGPVLARVADGRLFATDDGGAVWRLLAVASDGLPAQTTPYQDLVPVGPQPGVIYARYRPRSAGGLLPGHRRGQELRWRPQLGSHARTRRQGRAPVCGARRSHHRVRARPERCVPLARRRRPLGSRGRRGGRRRGLRSRRRRRDALVSRGAGGAHCGIHQRRYDVDGHLAAVYGDRRGHAAAGGRCAVTAAARACRRQRERVAGSRAALAARGLALAVSQCGHGHGATRGGHAGDALRRRCPGRAAAVGAGADPHATPVTAVEYYHRGLDHYFISADAGEMAGLDAQMATQRGFARTGLEFTVWPAGAAAASPVCRFYAPPSVGIDSHFFSAFPAECEDVRQRFPDIWIYETPDAFETGLPGVAGACATGLPVFRLFNGRADANHRYTTSALVRAAMIQSGWIAEGYGPEGVAMCTAP